MTSLLVRLEKLLAKEDIIQLAGVSNNSHRNDESDGSWSMKLMCLAINRQWNVEPHFPFSCLISSLLVQCFSYISTVRLLSQLPAGFHLSNSSHTHIHTIFWTLNQSDHTFGRDSNLSAEMTLLLLSITVLKTSLTACSFSAAHTHHSRQEMKTRSRAGVHHRDQ